MLVVVTVLVTVFCDVYYAVAFPGEAVLDLSARLFSTEKRALLELPGTGASAAVSLVVGQVVGVVVDLVGQRNVERRRGEEAVVGVVRRR